MLKKKESMKTSDEQDSNRKEKLKNNPLVKTRKFRLEANILDKNYYEGSVNESIKTKNNSKGSN